MGARLSARARAFIGSISALRSVADIAERKNMGRFDAAMPFSTVAGVMWPAPTYDEARDLGEI